MDKERALREIDAIYRNCKEHMKNTLEDWQKVYDALRKVYEKYDSDLWVLEQVLRAYEALEEYWEAGGEDVV